MTNRDRYYRFDKFPNKITLSSQILYMLVEMYPEISDKAFELAKNETKNDIIIWLNKTLGENNYSINSEIIHHTKDPEDLVDGLFEGKINLTIPNCKDILKQLKIEENTINRMIDPLNIELGQEFKIKTKSKLTKEEKTELTNALGFFFRKPSYDYLGDEHLPHKYFINVGKIAKQGCVDSIVDSYIIKVPTRGQISLISPYDDEFTSFLNKIEKLKLSRQLKLNLKENTPIIKKMKL